MNTRTAVLCVVLLALVQVHTLRAQSFRAAYETGRIELEEDLVIGGDTEDDDYILYGPSDLGVDASGNIFVLDYKMYWIRKYDRDGGHVRTFSRQGEGPGELQRAYNMTVTPGGQVAVFDSGNHRITVFDNDGEFARDRRFQGFVGYIQAGPDGSMYVLAGIQTEEWMEKGTLKKLVRFSPDLSKQTAVDSAYVKDTQLLHATDNAMTVVSSPFVPQLLCAVAPGGELVLGAADEYELRVLSRDLAEVAVIERSVERIKISEEDKEEYYDSFRVGDDPDFQLRLRKNVEFPRHKPYFSKILIDHEGYVLVETYEEAASEGDAVYDVFTLDGSFVNRVESRAMRANSVFHGGYVYMTRSAEDELPAVVRYRLKTPPGSGGS